MSTNFEPGIYSEAQVPMAAYCADALRDEPTLSSGVAFTMLSESPLHAFHRHPKLGGRRSDDTLASDVGTLAHSLLLGGEARICEIVADDWRTKAAKEQRDLARSNGLVPILAHHMGAVRRMVSVAREFISASEIARLFESGAPEYTVIAQDGDAWLRTRPDWLNLEMGISLSFKTTKAKVSPDAFARMVDGQGYGFALMFYERCLELALTPCYEGKPVPRVRHIILAQEQSAPYACSLFELAPAKAAIERSQVDRAIRLWSKCVATKSWPGYSGGIVQLEPKPWDLAAEEARLQAEEMEAMEA